MTPFKVWQKPMGAIYFRHLFHEQVFKKTSKWTLIQNNESTSICSGSWNAFRGRGFQFHKLLRHSFSQGRPSSSQLNLICHREPDLLTGFLHFSLPATGYGGAWGGCLLWIMRDLPFLLPEQAPGLTLLSQHPFPFLRHEMDLVWPDAAGTGELGRQPGLLTPSASVSRSTASRNIRATATWQLSSTSLQMRRQGPERLWCIKQRSLSSDKTETVSFSFWSHTHSTKAGCPESFVWGFPLLKTVSFQMNESGWMH